MSAAILATLAALVSLVATIFWVHQADVRTQERLVAKQTLEANLWARMLSARMEAHQRLLTSIAEGMHSSLLDKPAVLDALMQQDGSMLRLFESLHVALPSGDVTHHAPVGMAAQINSVGSDSLRRAMVDGKPNVMFLNVLEDLQHLSLLLSVPMRTANGQLAGALGAKVKLPIAALMPKMGSSDDQVRYVLLDSDGRVLAQSDMAQQPLHADALFAQHPDQWQALSQPSTANADTQLWGQTLVSRVGLPLPQWQAVIVRDLSREGLLAQAPPLTQLLAWLGTAVTLVLLSIMAWWRRSNWQAAQTSQAAPDTFPDTGAQPEPDPFNATALAVWEAVPAAMLVEQGGRLRTMTPQVRTLLGYGCNDLAAVSLAQLVQASSELSAARQALANVGNFEGVLALRKKDGDYVSLQAAAWAYVMASDVTVWRLRPVWQLQAAMPLPDKEHVWQDPLTGLPNRDALMWGLQAWVTDSVQAAKSQTTDSVAAVSRIPAQGCVLFADVDHLGMMNEITSREMGNELLRQVARFMAHYTASLGKVARLGGDEFAALLPGVSLAHAQGIAQTLCNAVWHWQPHWEGERHWVSISIGVVAVDALRHTPQQALHAADMACYEAKRRGRCQVAVGQISAQPELQPD